MKRNRRKGGVEAATQMKAPELDWREVTKHGLVLALIVLAMVTYSNSFHGPFLLDSNETILQDTRVHAVTPENIDRILGGPYYQAILAGLYRPLTTLSYLFNYAVLGNGADPNGYHWLNFWLHAANIALVYALGLVLFAEIPAALALAALWGLHPVLTEAVTNIVGRADMLAAFGVLAALLCYHHSLRSAGARRAAWIAGIALATAIGICSKENAVVAIAAVALYDWTFARGATWRARATGYAAVAIPAAVFFLARARVLGRFPAGPFPFTDNPLLGGGFWTARMTAVKVIGKYFGLLVWPARLSPDYSYKEIRVAVDAGAILALVVCLAAVALAIWAWRRHKPLFFAILFFFATLAPTSNVFLLIGSIMGERFLYLPAVGFAAAVVYGLQALGMRVPRARTASAGALGIVLLALACRTYARNRDWLDDQRLWSKAVEAVPNDYAAHIARAAATPLIKREDRALAAAEIGRALAILDPLPDKWNSAYGYRQAGVTYRELGDSLALGRAAPDGTEPAVWYGKSLNALLRSERIELALDQTYKEINARRGTPQSTFLPGVLYLEMGRTYLRLLQQAEAMRALEIGRALEPNAELLEELGATYESLTEPRRAAQAYVEALEVDSRRTNLTGKLIELYGKIDPGGCAISHEGGAALNLACPLVHSDICGGARSVAAAYLRRNQTAEADAIRQVARVDLGCAEETLK